MRNPDVRLTPHVKPQKYDLLITPNLKSFTFEGQEGISLVLDRPTKVLTLHSLDLEIFNVYFNGQPAASVKYNNNSETVTFGFKKAFPKGKGLLILNFKGTLSEGLKGFYRSRYVHEGQEKFLATTQFEATDARRAFPCFDEPAQKAVFNVSLKIPSAHTAISNTIETKITDHKDGLKTIKFAPSPRMSTYLLAFIVGDFEFIQTKSKRGVKVRVFVTQGKKRQAEFALKTAARALDFYEQYFNIKYPLPVLDLIALPDFASAAMENWGAITYRETALLVDDQNSSAANKQWVAIVIAHEIAHQWFGNLVTMEWWTDLWLNEGFASYMEYLATDFLFPQWKMWEQYVSGRMSTALKLDALATSHPIEVTVHHPNEISEIFDQVSYAKGSAVIRMLAEFLGPKIFRDGLRHYLKKHAYKNTVTKDLWESFEIISKKPVSAMMQVWTKKVGYPVVSVTENGGQLKLSQKRFFSSSVSKTKSLNKTNWKIPARPVYQNGTANNVFLEKTSQNVKKGGQGFVKLNSGETSLFRTQYSSGLLELLKPAIAGKKLSSSDRLGIIRDAFSLAEAGEFPTVEALKLSLNYANETELPVWEELVTGISSVGGFYKDQPWYPKYENFARQLFAPLVKKLGWQKKPGETHMQGILRSLALAALGAYGDSGTIKKARELFNGHMKNKPITADLRGVVYNLVAQNGGQKEFRQMKQLYKKAGSHHEEQDRIGRAMGSFKDKQVLADVIKFAIGDEVRTQDTPSIFIGAARNFYGCHLAWQFFKANWEFIYSRYGTGLHLLEWFVVPFSRFAKTSEAKDYGEFFKKHPAPNVSRAIQQVLERIYSNEAWIKRDQQNLASWLNKNF